MEIVVTWINGLFEKRVLTKDEFENEKLKLFN